MSQVVCADCKAKPPEVESEQTLATLSWSVTRKRDAEGQYVVESRCPDCWKKLVQSKRRPTLGG